MRAAAPLRVGVLAVAAACGRTGPSTPSPAAADVDAIVDHVRRVHPVNVGTIWWQKSAAGTDDPRLAFEPGVRVPVRWADLAAGRDRALEVAVAEAAA